MNFYVLRHGIAVERGTRGYKEPQRPLTKKGVRRMKEAAAGMRRLKLSFDTILTSPYARAKRTAEIVAAEMGLEKKIKLESALIPEGDAQRFVAETAKKYADAENILIVGHEPYLSRLIATLASNGSLSLNLRKGALCKLTVEALDYTRCGQLDWLLTSKQLARI